MHILFPSFLVWWTNSLVGVLSPAISCTKLKIYSPHAVSPMARALFGFSIFREDQSLLHRPRSSEESKHGGPTPLWVSAYTSYPLYKAQDPFSTCRQSHGQSTFGFSIIREDQSLLHRPRSSGRE